MGASTGGAVCFRLARAVAKKLAVTDGEVDIGAGNRVGEEVVEVEEAASYLHLQLTARPTVIQAYLNDWLLPVRGEVDVPQRERER